MCEIVEVDRRGPGGFHWVVGCEEDLTLGWPSSVTSLFAEVEFLSGKAFVGAVRVFLSDEDGAREGSVDRFEKWGWEARVEGIWWHVS